MRNTFVIGAGFGDEGKGRVVDYLCEKSPNPIVVRFSGGHQAGHHVIRGSVDHVFSNFGSGSILGAPTYWSKFCTVDPDGTINERIALLGKGVTPTLYIDPKCPITTPGDKFYNTILEGRNHHGSCGVGFGTTIQREADGVSLLFGDLFNKTVLKIKLKLITEYYQQVTRGSEWGANEWRWGRHNWCDSFMESCEELIELPNILIQNQIPSGYSDYIFEGSQGLLLDQHIGFFPHVTRSNTGCANARVLFRKSVPPKIYLVTRAYQTRHGNGPMTNEGDNAFIRENPYEQNFSTGNQGEFRRSILDLDLINYALDRERYIRKRAKAEKVLVITCLDLLEQFTLTHESTLHYFDEEQKFVDYITTNTGFTQVKVSKTPSGDFTYEY